MNENIEDINLLLIEDNEHDKVIIEKTLTNEFVLNSGLNFHITQCNSAEDALKIIEKNDKSFGVLLVDYILPGKSGLEFCEIIINKKIEIPIVFFSGLGTIDTAVAAIKMGVSDYIIKDNTRQYLKFLQYTLRNAYLKQKEINARRKAEAKLAKYAKTLERINHYKELFIDIIRHDLLNFANSINMGVRLLTEYEKEEADDETSKSLIKSTNQLIELIQNASKFSNLENISELDFKEVNINDYITYALENIEHIILEKKITVNNLTENNLTAPANILLIDVFINILINAANYAYEGKVVETEISEHENNCLISFIDYGKGIEDRHKETIFQRFERLEKKGIKGTGLGLAICKRIIELHNGKIWVEDNPSGGAVFKVSIPKDRSIQNNSLAI
ncbi:MAG: hybrid sensor histidine kinase/response regulator [Spirochaetia bacterium]|nr:hybrid sensor histidine kinase/response regulator [Spirochaetia bacterium]